MYVQAMNTDQFLFGKPTLIPPFTTDRLLTVNKAAAALDCNPFTIYRWISKGYIPSYRCGEAFIRVRVSDLYRYLFNDGKSNANRAKKTEYSPSAAKRKPKSKAPTAPAKPEESAK
jgi:excisionase family DNA binding protein